MSDPSPSVDRLLELLRTGDEAARKELFERLYVELKAIARRQLARVDGGDSLQPTDLLHEAWFKLHSSGGAAPEYQSQFHFCCVAAKAMRSVLVDHARQRAADKRGAGNRALSLDRTGALSSLDVAADGGVELLPLHDALARLSQTDAELGELVELRYFAGLRNEEIAALRGLSLATIERRFAVARAWLYRALEGNDSAPRRDSS